MSQKILVTYASRAGSTAGVAEAIGKTLRENGAQVDVIPMQEVTEHGFLSGRCGWQRHPKPAVVARSGPIRANHQSILNQKPFAMFAVCMTLAMKNGESYRPQIAEWLAPVRRLVRPMSEGIFAGALDISKIPSFSDRLKFRLSVLFGVWSEGDHRDWDAIRDWADSLPTKLF